MQFEHTYGSFLFALLQSKYIDTCCIRKKEERDVFTITGEEELPPRREKTERKNVCIRSALERK